MNYIVKSAGNGVSQKRITIDFDTISNTITVEGEVFVCDSEDGGYHYDIADWEITHLDGKSFNHASVWDALTTLHGEPYTTLLATDIEAALIEVAGTMVPVKTPQNAPQPIATDLESMTMEHRAERIDWEAVKYMFEHNFPFSAHLRDALDDADLDNAADVEVNSSYGSREFSVEVSFDTRELASQMEDSIADAIYEFCDASIKLNASATAA